MYCYFLIHILFSFFRLRYVMKNWGGQTDRHFLNSSLRIIQNLIFLAFLWGFFAFFWTFLGSFLEYVLHFFKFGNIGEHFWFFWEFQGEIDKFRETSGNLKKRIIFRKIWKNSRKNTQKNQEKQKNIFYQSYQVLNSSNLYSFTLKSLSSLLGDFFADFWPGFLALEQNGDGTDGRNTVLQCFTVLLGRRNTVLQY